MTVQRTAALAPQQEDEVAPMAVPGDDMPDAAGARSGIGRLVPLAVLLAGLALFLSMGWHRYLSWETLQENREALRAYVEAVPVRAALIFVLVYTMAAAFSIPGAVFLSVGGGFLFGAFGGAALAVTAATMGSLCVFLAARTALREPLSRRFGSTLNRLERGFQENAFSYMLFLRLMPVFPFWLVNLAAPLLGVRARTFVLGTFLGIIPGGFVYASVGNGLGAVLDAGDAPDLSVVTRPEILLPILGMAVLSLIPIAYRHYQARREDRR